MRNLLAKVTLVAALLLGGLLPVEAQNTRQQNTQINAATFSNCSNQCITGPMVKTYNDLVNAAVGYLNDLNLWTGFNVFSQSPALPGTGFAYANGAGNPVTYKTSTVPNPSSITLGGVLSDSLVAHQWIAWIDTNGLPHQSQPTFADIGGNNITQDVYFGSGRPWCDPRFYGAAGNQVTDDSAAFNSCRDQLVSVFGGGVIHITAGNYCLKTGLNITSGIIYIEGDGAAEIQVCDGATSVTTLTLNSGFSAVKNLTIAGPQLTAGVVPTGNAMTIGSSCERCIVENTNVVFGKYPVQVASSDNTIISNQWYDGYGGAINYVNGAGYFIRNTVDQNFPISTPAFPLTAPSQWASSHSYSGAGLLVSAGPSCPSGPNCFYIQLNSASCTSAGSMPIPPNYGVPVTDGTCQWYLAAPLTYYCRQYDTGANVPFSWGEDFTCPGTYDIAITNTGLAAFGPQGVHIDASTTGYGFAGGLLASDGFLLSLSHMDMNNCWLSTCREVFITSNWQGQADIHDNFIEGGNNGVVMQVGPANIVSGNIISGMATSAINVSSPSGGATVTDNVLGTSLFSLNGRGVSFSPTPGDYNIVQNNNCQGLTAANCYSGIAAALTAGPHSKIDSLAMSESPIAPVIAAGFGGGSPTVNAPNGTKSFQVTIGTASGSTGQLTMPTAQTGWNCSANDLTTHTAANFQVLQTVQSPTSVTFTDYSDIAGAATWVAGDVLAIQCASF